MNERPTPVKPSDDVVEIPKSALVVLARLLAPLVADVLRTAPTADVFTSREGERPPHTTRRAFRERCPTISTARREGKVWIVPCADWFASFRRPTVRAVPVSGSVANDATVADDFLAAAGLRPTRRLG